ncbi:hypothetical protein HRR83_001653 [Exophiala dermatitidis]|nr:hypothetical protein HRR73_004787 [Exophiala dermatitidis]KAJ4523131.1 hypothetical protein HRR75_001530 [Exophiala dermatitidis]KAJ4526459.1 hypothetical protein HRR74_001657 [Exophiala dermatitidis]KAJ4560099.1 hypothetical protein HRR78_000624 [Exophiala dermatitidis]KAJ4567422.1 hypothetical protein HRR79_004941 [Exophiala dermatitidis]
MPLRIPQASVPRIAQLTVTRTRTVARPFSSSITKMASNKDTSSLDAGKGSVGHEFTEKGSVGGTAQQVGGPFDKEGAIGKQFKPEGSVGGTAQSAAEQMQGDKPGLFDKDGAIGKQFRPEGNIGQVGEAVGGPFSSKGAIGKHFNADGSVGGAVQENLGDGKKK